MTVSHYEVKFTQLLRYPDKLVSEEEDRTKRFVRGLRSGIRSQLVPFQIQIYSQAVEKALEVKRDMQENQDIRAKESPTAKHFRYLSAPRMGSPGFRFGGSIGPSASPAQRTVIGSWPKDAGSLQDSPHTSFPRYNST